MTDDRQKAIEALGRIKHTSIIALKGRTREDFNEDCEIVLSSLSPHPVDVGAIKLLEDICKSAKRVEAAPRAYNDIVPPYLINEARDYLRNLLQGQQADIWPSFFTHECGCCDVAIEGEWVLAACKAHRKESLAYRKANPELKGKGE